MSIQNNTAVDVYQNFVLPTALDSDFSSEDLADDMEGLQLTMQRVKIPGGGNLQFEIRGDDPDNPDYERKLVGVILYHHLANAYWPEGSEYDDNVPPFCQSFDGKQGYGEPGGVCAACAFNQFGSTANGSGKACKNMRQIYLLRSGEYLPLQLSLPPTSLRPFNDFMNLAFVARRRPSYSAIVEIGLKRAESGGYTYSVATFRKVRDLEGEGLAAVKSYAANFKEQVKSLLAQRVENYKSDVESLTGAAAQTQPAAAFRILAAPKRNMLPKAPRHRRSLCGRKAHSRLPPPVCADSPRASMTRCSAASRGRQR